MTGNKNDISATPSRFKAKLPLKGRNRAILPNNPVEEVSWYDVLVFCNRLSIQEGLTPVYSISGSTNPDRWGNVPTIMNVIWSAVRVNSSAKGYRLPTDAEWQYAARGGSRGRATTYAGSNNIDDVAWYWINSGDKILSGAWHWNKIEPNNSSTRPVGGKNANELGIYDMSGNVIEWTFTASDSYRGYRVGRGGSWFNNADNCEVSYRCSYNPDFRFPDFGFRVLRTQ